MAAANYFVITVARCDPTYCTDRDGTDRKCH